MSRFRTRLSTADWTACAGRIRGLVLLIILPLLTLEWFADRRSVLFAAVGAQRRKAHQSNRIALLIDGDNQPPQACQAIIESLSKLGHVTIRRFYAEPFRFHKQLGILKQINVTPVPISKCSAGYKEVTDMCIAWDAALLAAGSLSSIPGVQEKEEKEPVTSIAIASDDSDFLEVLKRLRIMKIAGYLVQNACYMTPHMLKLAKERGVQLVGYDRAQQKCGKAVVMQKSGKSTFQQLDDPHAKRFLDEECKMDICATVNRRKYLSADEAAVGLISAMAAAKLFYANGLGPIVLYPTANRMEEVHKALATKPEPSFAVCPRSLIYIEPVGGKTKGETSQGVMKGGGPFLLKFGASLVRNVLVQMRYLKTHEPQHLDSAIKLFWKLNERSRRRHGLPNHDADSVDVNVLRDCLHSAFSGQACRQQWRIPLSDEVARGFLHNNGLLTSCQVSDMDVTASIRAFLSKKGIKNSFDPSYYLGAVAQMTWYLTRKDPSKRKRLV